MRFATKFCATLVGVIGLGTAQVAFAVIFAQHLGDADPTTEGWTAVPGSSSTVGAIDDGGTPAWFVDDASLAGGTFYYYRRSLTPSEVAAAANPSGWTLSTTIRVPSTQRTDYSFSPGVDYRDGAKIWAMSFDVVNGNTQVQLISGINNQGTGADGTSGPIFTVAGTSTYNTFELRYDPITLTADLFVNGVEQISNFAGWNLIESPGVFWGSLSSIDAGRGHFNAVTFMTTVPEAGGLLLMGGAGVLSLVVVGVRRVVQRRGPAVSGLSRTK